MAGQLAPAGASVTFTLCAATNGTLGALPPVSSSAPILTGVRQDEVLYGFDDKYRRSQGNCGRPGFGALAGRSARRRSSQPNAAAGVLTMVVRWMANAAVHGIAGTVLGITTVFAACTVAQSMRQMVKRDLRGGSGVESGFSGSS